MTPLHNAAQTGQPEAVKALIDAKAMVNIRLVGSELGIFGQSMIINLNFLSTPRPHLDC